MIVSLNEKISVCALFDQNRIKPIWFVYKNIKFVIKQICYRWKEKEGDDVIYKFTVADDSNIYEIAYSTRATVWSLLAIDEGGY